MLLGVWNTASLDEPEGVQLWTIRVVDHDVLDLETKALQGARISCFDVWAFVEARRAFLGAQHPGLKHYRDAACTLGLLWRTGVRVAARHWMLQLGTGCCSAFRASINFTARSKLCPTITVSLGASASRRSKS